MRILILMLLAVLVALQFRLWVGEGSLADLHGLKQEIAAQEQELDALRARNQELQAEVMDLREGIEALEERARRDLGMIKPGEIFIQVIERQPKEATTP
jgi:cell division protein FtsB